MPLKARDEYVASLRSLKRRVFILGEEVEHPNDHPLVLPSRNAVAMTYELAQQPARVSRSNVACSGLPVPTQS